MLHPSLPPRPSFPKSPSPQENTKPNKHQTAGQTMITVFSCTRKLLEQDIPTFICQSKSLSISASTSNLNDSVAKEHFNLQSRKSKRKFQINYVLKPYRHFQALIMISFIVSSLSMPFSKGLSSLAHSGSNCSMTVVASSYERK